MQDHMILVRLVRNSLVILDALPFLLEGILSEGNANIVYLSVYVFNTTFYLRLTLGRGAHYDCDLH